MIVTAAQTSDYADILALNDGAVPHVNRIDENRLAHLHAESLYLGVAKAPGDDGIAGFLLALPEHADYDSENFAYFRRTFSSFVYVDRIVVSPNHRRGGVGAALYADLARHVPADCQRITCEVNLRPPNPGSMAFHSRLGFAPVGEQETGGGAKRVRLLAREVSRA